MSRHIPRHARWRSHGPSRWISVDGVVVHFTKGAWWADIAYRLQQVTTDDSLPTWEACSKHLGPFKHREMRWSKRSGRLYFCAIGMAKPFDSGKSSRETD